MNLRELKTLRGQLLLTAGLFLACLFIAAAIVSQRWRFESFVREKYSASADRLSKPAHEVAEAIEQGEAPVDVYSSLGLEERRALYELWMLDKRGPQPRMARALVATDPEYYLRCAEQSVVCGDDAQRKRAIEFLAVCEAPQAKDILQRLAAWAQQRQRTDWKAEIEKTINPQGQES